MTTTRRARRFTTDEVIEAGRACLARDGLDGLTMRAVAAELGTAPMTLYRYVADRDDLVAGAVDRSLAALELPPDPPATPPAIRAWLQEVAQRARPLLLAHPGAADHLLVNGPTGPWTLAFMDHVCRVLALTGRPPEEVAWSYDWLVTTAVAYISKEARLAGGGSQVAATLQRRAAELARHPDLRAIVAAFTGDMATSYTRATGFVIAALVPDPDDGEAGGAGLVPSPPHDC